MGVCMLVNAMRMRVRFECIQYVGMCSYPACLKGRDTKLSSLNYAQHQKGAGQRRSMDTVRNTEQKTTSWIKGDRQGMGIGAGNKAHVIDGMAQGRGCSRATKMEKSFRCKAELHV